LGLDETGEGHGNQCATVGTRRGNRSDIVWALF